MLLHEGVYAGLLGPQYETPAGVQMLRALGADAIGMSTVLEVIQACALGLEVAGFSCLTNLAVGILATRFESRGGFTNRQSRGCGSCTTGQRLSSAGRETAPALSEVERVEATNSGPLSELTTSHSG
jgi:hypothetical protein